MVYRIRYCQQPEGPLEVMVVANNCAEALVRLRYTLTDLHSPLVTSICAEAPEEPSRDEAADPLGV